MIKKILAWLVGITILACFLFIFVYKYKPFLKTKLQKAPSVYKLVQKTEDSLDKIINVIKKRKGANEKQERYIFLINANQVVEKYEKFWGGIGQDFFYSGVTLPKNKALFEHISQLNKERKAFFFYRAHNMFSDRDAPNGEKSGGKVYAEDEYGNPIYSWGRIDRVFDTLMDAGLIPIVEFSFTPEALTTDPNRLGDWRAANVAPPKDYHKWKNLIKETIRHLQSRYGEREIEKWYFEVWNEPDLWYHFWIPDKKNNDRANVEEYLKLYDYTVAGALEANPNIKIGGPALAGWPYFLQEFLEHGKDESSSSSLTSKTRIDFYSFHKYGSIEKSLIKYTKIYVETALAVSNDLYSKTPFLITEFGPRSTRFKDNWKNTPYLAAWICKSIDGMFTLGEEYGRNYRPEAMIYWGTVGESYLGDGGAIAVCFGGKKENFVKGPLFNIYDLLSYLGNERLKVIGNSFGDYVRCIATRHDETHFQLLIYNLDDKLRSVGSQKDSVTVQLKLQGLVPGKYFVNQFKIDSKHCNPYSIWRSMGGPAKLSRQQIKLLQQNDDVRPTELVYQFEKFNSLPIEHELKIEANSVYLMQIKRVTDNIPPISPKKILRKESSYHSISLAWLPAEIASDGDMADHYLIYRNDKLVDVSSKPTFLDKNLDDGQSYQYKIFSVDDEGNKSIDALTVRTQTMRDLVAPKISDIYFPSNKQVEIVFSEPINQEDISNPFNYAIDGNVKINSVRADVSMSRVILNTTGLARGRTYVLQIKKIRDKAKIPNAITDYKQKLTYFPMFVDYFYTNTTSKYNIIEVNGKEISRFLRYDEHEQKANFITGDNIKRTLSHSLPRGVSGVFRVTIYPYKIYPAGGLTELKLKYDDENYISLKNSDGYGPGSLALYINGSEIASAKLSHEYRQKKDYQIEIVFDSKKITASAFGEYLIISHSLGNMPIQKFEISLSQQDAFIDDIFYKVTN